jgi:hypothetical protein
MKYKGVTYDVGTEYTLNSLTREIPDEAVVKSDMAAIKNMLNCNSVRIWERCKNTDSCI